MPESIVIIPCFNEAQRLDVRAFVEHSVRRDSALLFVNDGSSDDTAGVLDDLCAISPTSLSVLHLPHNCGKAEAVRRGVLQALQYRPTFVGYWDADLATPLDAIGEFQAYLAAHPSVEMLLGARVRLLGSTIERRISRHCAGRVFATAASWVLKLPVYDTQCGAKLFRVTNRICSLFAEPFRSRWIFDVELLARFVRSTSSDGPSPEELIHELPLRQWRDVAGSKVRFCDFIRAAIQLAGIAYHYPRLATHSVASARESTMDLTRDTSPAAHRPAVSRDPEREPVS